jgi:hypothetical protein
MLAELSTPELSAKLMTLEQQMVASLKERSEHWPKSLCAGCDRMILKLYAKAKDQDWRKL